MFYQLEHKLIRHRPLALASASLLMFFVFYDLSRPCFERILPEWKWLSTTFSVFLLSLSAFPSLPSLLFRAPGFLSIRTPWSSFPPHSSRAYLFLLPVLPYCFSVSSRGFPFCDPPPFFSYFSAHRPFLVPPFSSSHRPSFYPMRTSVFSTIEIAFIIVSIGLREYSIKTHKEYLTFKGLLFELLSCNGFLLHFRLVLSTSMKGTCGCVCPIDKHIVYLS